MEPYRVSKLGCLKQNTKNALSGLEAAKPSDLLTKHGRSGLRACKHLMAKQAGALDPGKLDTESHFSHPKSSSLWFKSSPRLFAIRFGFFFLRPATSTRSSPLIRVAQTLSCPGSSASTWGRWCVRPRQAALAAQTAHHLEVHDSWTSWYRMYRAVPLLESGFCPFVHESL